eukprot:14503435-Alexandrium_andersonii.AAC.1
MRLLRALRDSLLPRWPLRSPVASSSWLLRAPLAEPGDRQARAAGRLRIGLLSSLVQKVHEVVVAI